MSINVTEAGLGIPAGLVPAGGVVEGGGDREKVTAQALRVLGKGMTIWAPTAKRLLAACLGLNPTRQQQPTPETLKVHVEDIGSGFVLIPCLDIELDAEQTMYEIIRQALIKNGRLGPSHHCYFLQNGQKCNLDVKPADYRFSPEINLIRVVEESPVKNQALSLVRQNGGALYHVGWELRADRDVVLAAVSQNGGALECAAEELKADRDVVLAAVRKDGEALEFAAWEFRADRDVVLAAVRNSGWTLQYAAPELRGDREVVLAAVSQSRWALRFAAPELRADREVVLAAVSQCGWALEFAADALKANKEVVLAAVSRSSTALQFADPVLQKDLEVRAAAGR